MYWLRLFLYGFQAIFIDYIDVLLQVFTSHLYRVINVHNWLYYISIIHFVNYKPSYIYDQIFLVTSKPFSV